MESTKSETKRAEAAVQFEKTEDGPIFTIRIPLYVQNPKPFAYGTLEVAREELQMYFRHIEMILKRKQEAEGLIKPQMTH